MQCEYVKQCHLYSAIVQYSKSEKCSEPEYINNCVQRRKIIEGLVRKLGQKEGFFNFQRREP